MKKAGARFSILLEGMEVGNSLSFKVSNIKTALLPLEKYGKSKIFILDALSII